MFFFELCDFTTTKAFDMVSRDGLWQVLTKFGCSAKFVNVVEIVYSYIFVIYSCYVCILYIYISMVFMSMRVS